ncbi:MAG: neutral/alkaline non-lysosomal ceramidase N-terminal domain-containing protein [Thermofilaceae archaeon]
MIKTGSSCRVITPPLGIPMGGYASRPGPAMGVHDDLHARALVIKNGGDLCAILSLELLYVTQDVVKEVREIAEEKVGIPADAVMVAAVHTHSGPSIMGLHTEGREDLLEKYMASLSDIVSNTLIDAAQGLVEVNLRFGEGGIDGWTINRRKPYSGPLDNKVAALCFEQGGSAVATIVNFTCHAVVLGHSNLLISADYPGYVSQTVEKIFGGVCLFLNGACGEVNPLTPGTMIEKVYDRSMGTFRDAEEMGISIACKAIEALLRSSRVEDAVIKVGREAVQLEVLSVPEVQASDLDDVKEELARAEKAGDKARVEQLKLKAALTRWMLNVQIKLRERVRNGYLSTEVQAIRVGDFVIVGLPGEPFVEIGLAVKQFSPAALTMIVGYANDAIGYVPMDEAFDEGGYEVMPPACILGKGAAQALAEAAWRLLLRLYE